MSADKEIRLTLSQLDGYAFRIDFGDALPELLSDEPSPLGNDRGPNPSRLLLAAVANCLSASLIFALRKFKNEPGPLQATVTSKLERNSEGRWRIPRAKVELQLAEGSEAHPQIERVLAQFEEFCVVTQSVRDGIEVEVEVRDAHGTLIHHRGAATP
ncbi:MAG TPA: OsmC family protein [Arenimonas sp.]|nr:OsmC family protein [Arenimonas sp.]